MRVIERVAEHYDVQEMPFGRVYRWSPEQVVLECSGCGKRTTRNRSEIISSETTECECGKGHAARIREEAILGLIDEEYACHGQLARDARNARSGFS
jgi:hypothetical protein